MGWPWSNEEMDVLKKLVMENKTNAEIATVLKIRTESGIGQKRAALKLPAFGNGERLDLDAYARMMKGESKCL